MDYESQRKELLKEARNAFEYACTLNENQRMEVYLDNGKAKISDVLDDTDEIVYTEDKILCYRVYGHDYLEQEIKIWIDYAREIKQPDGETPLPEPTDIEKSIRELIDEIAKRNGVAKDDVSSFEVFANLPMDLLGSIEQQIIEYWWNANEEENAKTLAIKQIEDVMGTNPLQ